MNNIKDTISSIVAVILVFIEPINYLLISDQPFSWRTFILSLLGALIAYSTGKNADLSKKTTAQVEIQKEEQKLPEVKL